MDLPKRKDDLVKFFNKKEFVRACCEQINKDIHGLTDQQPQFNLDTDRNILDQLTEQLSETLKTMPSKNLQQFIYRVDLPENDYLKAIAQKDELYELAFLVIRREAQKVFIRKSMSG